MKILKIDCGKINAQRKVKKYLGFVNYCYNIKAKAIYFLRHVVSRARWVNRVSPEDRLGPLDCIAAAFDL